MLFSSLLLSLKVAHAGACCLGATSTFPARVGECETSVAALTLGGELALGRWDSTGKLQDASLTEQALLSTVAGAVRYDRQLQMGFSLPVRANHRASASAADWGGGPGDALVQVLWDPKEELPDGPPVPLLSVGLRLPTGRDWTESDSPLLADVTGLAAPAVTVGVQLERTLRRTPYNLALGTSWGFAEDAVQPSISASASLGHYFGYGWSALGALSWSGAWAALDGSASAVMNPRLGLSVVHGQAKRWRVWAGAELDLPAPIVGRSATRYAAATIGMARIR